MELEERVLTVGSRVRVSERGSVYHGRHGTVTGTGPLGTLSVTLDSKVRPKKLFMPSELMKVSWVRGGEK